VLARCIADPNCVAHYRRPEGDRLEADIARVGAQLPEVYAQIRDAAPAARLVVLGYPRLFPDDLSRNCAAWEQISQPEASYLNEKTRSLNAAIQAAALSSGVDFIDVTEAFDGLELRCDGESHVHRLRPAEKIRRAASFHPNVAGHHRLAEIGRDRFAPRQAPPTHGFVKPPG
jgi:hypothetical protein